MGKCGIRCQRNAQCCKLSSPRVPNFVTRLLIHEVPGCCAMWRLGHLVLCNKQNSGYESNCTNSSIYIPSSRLHHDSLFLPYLTHRQDPQPIPHHMTYTKQSLSLRNTPDKLHNFVCSPSACFRYMQLYDNANSSDGDSFSTHSDGTKGQLQRKREGNCYGKSADIGYKSTPVIGSGIYEAYHLATHPWTHPDIQCLRHQGW